MTTPTAATTWTGWHRTPGCRWRQVVSGATEDEAWQKLLSLDLPQGDRTVTRGTDPNAPAPRRPRRML